MLELIDLLRDWLEGDIQCQIEDVHGDYDSGEYLLFRGTVSQAFREFKKLADEEGIAYELNGYMQIDRSNGLLYIMVEEM